MEADRRSNLPASSAGVAAMGAMSLAIWLLLPAGATNGGMWLMFFLFTAAFALFLWQQSPYRSFTARKWGGFSLLFLAGFAVFWVAGIAYAYSRGVRDATAMLFEENGGFMLVLVLGLPLVLACAGGAVRASILKTAPVATLGAMTVNEQLALHGLFAAFDAAVATRDKSKVVAVLLKAQFTPEQAEYTASSLLRSPEKYGY